MSLSSRGSYLHSTHMSWSNVAYLQGSTFLCQCQISHCCCKTQCIHLSRRLNYLHAPCFASPVERALNSLPSQPPGLQVYRCLGLSPDVTLKCMRSPGLSLGVTLRRLFFWCRHLAVGLCLTRCLVNLDPRDSFRKLQAPFSNVYESPQISLNAILGSFMQEI